MVLILPGKKPEKPEAELPERRVAVIGKVDRIGVAHQFLKQMDAETGNRFAEIENNRMKIQFRSDLFRGHMFDFALLKNVLRLLHAFRFIEQSLFHTDGENFRGFREFFHNLHCISEITDPDRYRQCLLCVRIQSIFTDIFI